MLSRPLAALGGFAFNEVIFAIALGLDLTLNAATVFQEQS